MASIDYKGNTLVIDGNGAAKSSLVDANGNPCVIPSSIKVEKNETLLFRDSIEGNLINTQNWIVSSYGMIPNQDPATGINVNGSLNITGTGYSVISSARQFNINSKLRLHARLVPQANSIIEFGFGLPIKSNPQVATGAFWRYTNSGSLTPVVSYNGNDVAIGSDIGSLVIPSSYYSYEIITSSSNAEFICKDITTGKILSEQVLYLKSGQSKLWSTTHLPIFSRVYNTSTGPSMAASMYTTDITVTENSENKLVLGSETSPITHMPIVNWNNSEAPALGILSNTMPAYNTLGGLWSFEAVAGSSIDYVLFGFQVPAPYTFMCTGIVISSYNIQNTAPTLLHWGIGFNSVNAPLSTIKNGYNRVHLGTQMLEQVTPDLVRNFSVPYRTESGNYLAIILRMPVATASEDIIQGGIQITGYFE